MPINKKRYHKKWRLISYLIRVKRAQNKCEECQAEQGKPHPITGSIVMLTTAHLNRDRTNNRFTNLKALCQRCHIKFDRPQHIYSRKYGKETQYLNLKLFEVDPVIKNKAPVKTEAIFSTLNP